MLQKDTTLERNGLLGVNNSLTGVCISTSFLDLLTYINVSKKDTTLERNGGISLLGSRGLGCLARSLPLGSPVLPSKNRCFLDIGLLGVNNCLIIFFYFQTVPGSEQLTDRGLYFHVVFEPPYLHKCVKKGHHSRTKRGYITFGFSVPWVLCAESASREARVA